MRDLLEFCRMGFLRLIVGEHGLVVAHFKKVIENPGISCSQGFAFFFFLISKVLPCICHFNHK